MGVSLSASRGLSMATVKQAAALVVLVVATLAYLYGPPASPTLRQAAVSECNTHAGGNYRSYRLAWQVGIYPHWTCHNASRPQSPALDMGWWVSPLR